MADIVKAVKLTNEEHEKLRELNQEFDAAETALRTYESVLRKLYEPEGRSYAPFYDFPCQILRESKETFLLFDRKLRS
jgi:hypothetical protein